MFSFVSLLLTMTLTSSFVSLKVLAGPVATVQQVGDGSGQQFNILVKILVGGGASSNCSNNNQNLTAVFECSLFITTAGQQSGSGLKSVDVGGLISQQDCQQRCQQQENCVAFELRNVTDMGQVQDRTLLIVQNQPGTGNSQAASCPPCPSPSMAIPEGIMLATTTPPPTTTATTTTTTTTTVTTTTTQGTTTTTAPLPASAAQVAFSASSTIGTSQIGPVPLSASADYNTHYSANSNQFPVAVGGIYFVEGCTGVAAGQKVNLEVANAAPLSIGLTWDTTIQNGAQTLCRAGVVQEQRGTSLSWYLDSGSAFSDSNNLLSFTTFSVSNVMSDDALSRLVYAVGPSTPPPVNQTLTPLPMVTVQQGSSANFKPNTAMYTCTLPGPHFVSASVGVLPHMATEIQLTNPTVSVGMTRTTTLYDGVTTLSRNTIFDCEAGQTIQMNLLSGTTVNSDGVHPYNLTTLFIVPYEPRNITTPVAWNVLKWYISFNNEAGQGALDPFYFSNITVNIGNAYDFNARTVTAPVSGYYYVNLESGAGVGLNGDTFVLSLMKGTTTLFSIEHQSTSEGATDTFQHGEIIYLQKGEVIRVVAQEGSYIYSSLHGYEVQFMGMLLYTA